MRVTPARASRRWAAAPTPGRSETGLPARNPAASARPMTEKPRGLARSEAIFARNLLGASPIDTVMPTSASTRRANRASVRAGLPWWTRSVPVRSRKASSMETGSTAGVSSSISSRTARPATLYFSMSGLITTASGQAFKALNIGIADRTP